MVVERTVTVQAKAYRVIPSAHGVLVSSASHQGGWHVVCDGQCDCPGYRYRCHCAHVDAAAVVLGPRHAAAQGLLCRECGREPAATGRQECVNCLLYGR